MKQVTAIALENVSMAVVEQWGLLQRIEALPINWVEIVDPDTFEVVTKSTYWKYGVVSVHVYCSKETPLDIRSQIEDLIQQGLEFIEGVSE